MKKPLLILALAASAAYGGAGGQHPDSTNLREVSIDDFAGIWRAEYIHDPDNPADDFMNSSFELLLERDDTTADALWGWHSSSMRGGRKIDCADKDMGNGPSIRGELRGDTVRLYFTSSWEVRGEAKLYFAAPRQEPEERRLVWVLDDYLPEKEHYMPRRDTLRRITETVW